MNTDYEEWKKSIPPDFAYMYKREILRSVIVRLRTKLDDMYIAWPQDDFDRGYNLCVCDTDNVLKENHSA